MTTRTRSAESAPTDRRPSDSSPRSRAARRYQDSAADYRRNVAPRLTYIRDDLDGNVSSARLTGIVLAVPTIDRGGRDLAALRRGRGHDPARLAHRHARLKPPYTCRDSSVGLSRTRHRSMVAWISGVDARGLTTYRRKRPRSDPVLSQSSRPPPPSLPTPDKPCQAQYESRPS